MREGQYNIRSLLWATLAAGVFFALYRLFLARWPSQWSVLALRLISVWVAATALHMVLLVMSWGEKTARDLAGNPVDHVEYSWEFVISLLPICCCLLLVARCVLIKDLSPLRGLWTFAFAVTIWHMLPLAFLFWHWYRRSRNRDLGIHRARAALVGFWNQLYPAAAALVLALQEMR